MKTTNEDRRADQRPLLVIGMHRSGTSALARTLGLLGWHLPADLMIANQYNAAGYWEAAGVVHANEAMLGDVNSHWAEPAPLPPDWHKSDHAGKWRETATTALEESFGGSPNFVLKDPRLSLTLQFWLPLIQERYARPAVIIACRDPVEVANSLALRDGVDVSHAAALWLRYTLDAEQNSRGLDRAFVRYDDLLRDWRATLIATSNQLNSVWQEPDAEVAAGINLFLDRRLRHHVAGTEPIDEHNDVMDLARKVYSKVGQARMESPRDWDERSDDFEQILLDLGVTGISSPMLKESAAWHFTNGTKYLRSDRPLEAANSAAKAIERAPAVFAFRSLLARSLMKLGESEKAVIEIEEAGRLGMPEIDHAHLMSAALSAAKKYDEAFEHALRIWEIGTDNCYLNARVAYTAWRVGRRDLALEAMETAIGQNPDLAGWHWSYVQWLKLEGQTEKALKAAETAVERTDEMRFRDEVRQLAN